MTTTNFPPGVTHVPCRYCNRMVDVRPESESWNENPRKPAHRLCENERPPPWWSITPLNVDQLKALWRMIVASETGKTEAFDEQTKRDILTAIRETLHEVNYHSGCRVNYANKVRRSRVLAARLIWLIDTRRWDLPLIYQHGRSTVAHRRDGRDGSDGRSAADAAGQ